MRAEAGMVAPVEREMEERFREIILARWTWSCCWEWSCERKGWEGWRTDMEVVDQKNLDLCR
jgi:hypothetical protein